MASTVIPVDLPAVAAPSPCAGNPEEFRGWLAAVKGLQAEQDAAAGRRPAWAGPKHYEVQLILHSVRHSDLRLHTYVPAALAAQPAPADADSSAGGAEAGGWQLPLLERVASLERGTAGSRAALTTGATGAGTAAAGAPDEFGSMVRLNPLDALEPGDLQVKQAVPLCLHCG